MNNRGKVSTRSVAVLIVLATFVATSRAAEALPQDKDVKPALLITGADSQFAEPTYYVIQSREEWQAVWLRHLGMTFAESVRDKAVPRHEFDFETYSVVALFLGEKSWAPGVHIHSIKASQESLEIRMEPESLQTSDPPKRLSAYAFLLVPRIGERDVEIYQGSRSLKAEEPTWTRQRVSDALDVPE